MQQEYPSHLLEILFHSLYQSYGKEKQVGIYPVTYSDVMRRERSVYDGTSYTVFAARGNNIDS